MVKSSVTKPLKDPRKTKYTNEQIKAIYIALDVYIQSTEFPMLAEFIAFPETWHKWKLHPNYIHNHPEYFDGLVSVMKAKCETYLAKQGLAGKAMPMDIFLLKQDKFGGYSDQQQIDLKSNAQPVKFVVAVPRPPKKNR